MEQRGEQLHDVPDLGVGECEHFARRSDVGELDCVVPAVARYAAALFEIVVIDRVCKRERVLLVMVETGEHAVENVVVSLVFCLFGIFIF